MTIKANQKKSEEHAFPEALLGRERKKKIVTRHWLSSQTMIYRPVNFHYFSASNCVFLQNKYINKFTLSAILSYVGAPEIAALVHTSKPMPKT